MRTRLSLAGTTALAVLALGLLELWLILAMTLALHLVLSTAEDRLRHRAQYRGAR